jgi:hypothetical protein
MNGNVLWVKQGTGLCCTTLLGVAVDSAGNVLTAGALFRSKVLAALDAAIAHGELVLPGSEAADPQAWDILRDRRYRTRWSCTLNAPSAAPSR